MENSKVIRTLKKLTEKETESFKAFAASPYFNKNQDLTAFLDIILKEGMLANPMNKSLVLDKMYAGQAYQERWLPDLMYGLMNLLEDFLAEEKYRQNRFQRKLNLMMLAYEKELEPVINGVIKDIDVIHSQNPIRDSNYFYESFMIESERDFSFRALGKISDNENIRGKADQLDFFYLALKLKDGCEMLNRANIVSAQYDFRLLNNLISYLQATPEPYLQYPAITIYYNIYLMLRDKDGGIYFSELVRLAGENESNFGRDELRSIYGYAQNYCIRRLNQGDGSFNRKLFDIYRHIFDNGLVFEDKNMQWDFKNFVSLGLRMKEYEWTLQIINAFKDRLPEEIRQNAYSYNLANYYYETGDYKKATRLLNSVEFTDIYYNLDSKAMLLKIYYKVEEEESFYSLVSSFGIYLRRNRLISESTAEVYRNLIRYTKKAFLLKMKLPYQRKKDFHTKVELLKHNIAETKNVANINWLLQEVGDLVEAQA
jgi:hypothetical protein